MKGMIAAKVLLSATLLLTISGCGGGGFSSPTPTPVPQQGTAQASISLHDMPPTGVTVLSFQATITGMTMQPGNVSVLSSPMTLEMTQLQGTSAYMGTVSLPVGTYTGMTITLSNPQMTFLNNSDGMMGGGGMIGGSGCANGQVCQLSPTLSSSSVSVTGSPFPINVQANTPFEIQCDFDLMDSLQSNMGMNPTMTSMMQQVAQGSNVLDDMDDMICQVSSVNSGNNQFAMSCVEGMSSMTVTTDTNTTFLGFDAIGKANSFSSLAQGQIVLARMQLMAGGTLHAEKVRFESTNQVLDGMIVAVNSSTQFDMVMTNDAPVFQGLNLGSLVRISMQAGSMFDIDDTDLPVSGMSFAASSDMMVGQVVQIETTALLVNGTPPQLNTNHVRLMKTWMTAKVGSVTNADTFTMQSLPGMMTSAGFSTMTVNTSGQTMFQNVANVAAMNMGDTISIRGPLFLVNGTPTIVCAKVLKR